MKLSYTSNNTNWKQMLQILKGSNLLLTTLAITNSNILHEITLCCLYTLYTYILCLTWNKKHKIYLLSITFTCFFECPKIEESCLSFFKTSIHCTRVGASASFPFRKVTNNWYPTRSIPIMHTTLWIIKTSSINHRKKLKQILIPFNT